MFGIEIAGIRIALEATDAELDARVRSRYAAFLTPPQSAMLVVRADVRVGAGVPTRDDHILRVNTDTHGDRLSYSTLHDEGWVDWGRTEGIVTVRPGADIENYLRVLYAHLAARSGGVMLHAAGAVRAGKGYVFFGPSGSGKSTVANMSLDVGLTVLGDDIVIVGREASTYIVYSVPFRGSNTRAPQINVSKPLAAAFTLVKADCHNVAQLERPVAVARLVQCAPFAMRDPVANEQIIETCSSLIGEIYAGQLCFRQDADFWRVIDDSIGTISDSAQAGGRPHH